MKVKVPRIEGDYVNVYKPSGDVFPGPAVGPLEAGRYYDEWVANDHCFIRDDGGCWHAFGITHPWSGLEEVHAGEFLSFHAVAPMGTLKAVLSEGAWRDQAKVLPPSQRTGEMLENHAPYIVKSSGLYHMLYGPSPLRHATSRDLYTWTAQGLLTDSPISRDPHVFLWEDAYYILTCGRLDVRMASLNSFASCGETHTILKTKENVDPESPTLVRHNDVFYLFVCGWNNVWDKEDLQGAYQHITYVYESEDPFRFDADKEITRLNAHAPEVFQDEEGDWYISSAEWPCRGVSIARLVWE
jgi:beta-fructofuranosidase